MPQNQNLPLYQPYPIQQTTVENGQAFPQNTPISTRFQNDVERQTNDIINNLREIVRKNTANIPPGYVEQEIIASNYVIPELFILNSKLYQSYVKRNNLIFSYLQNHEDFYRMSEFYLSHENPNIRSINKLLRDNQTKSVIKVLLNY